MPAPSLLFCSLGLTLLLTLQALLLCACQTSHAMLSTSCHPACCLTLQGSIRGLYYSLSYKTLAQLKVITTISPSLCLWGVAPLTKSDWKLLAPGVFYSVITNNQSLNQNCKEWVRAETEIPSSARSLFHTLSPWGVVLRTWGKGRPGRLLGY